MVKVGGGARIYKVFLADGPSVRWIGDLNVDAHIGSGHLKVLIPCFPEKVKRTRQTGQLPWREAGRVCRVLHGQCRVRSLRTVRVEGCPSRCDAEFDTLAPLQLFSCGEGSGRLFLFRGHLYNLHRHLGIGDCHRKFRLALRAFLLGIGTIARLRQMGVADGTGDIEQHRITLLSKRQLAVIIVLAVNGHELINGFHHAGTNLGVPTRFSNRCV